MKNNKYENLIITDYVDMEELIEDFNSKVNEMFLEQANIDQVCIYAKAPFIQRVFKQLVQYESIGLIDFATDDFDSDYRSIYCLSMSDDEYCHGYLNIEKAYNKDGYPYATEGVAFLYEKDVTQDLIDSILSDGTKAILFRFDSLKNKKNKTSVKSKKLDSGIKKKLSSDVDLVVNYKKGTEDIYGFEASQISDENSSYCSVHSTSPMPHLYMMDILYELGFMNRE